MSTVSCYHCALGGETHSPHFCDAWTQDSAMEASAPLSPAGHLAGSTQTHSGILLQLLGGPCPSSPHTHCPALRPGEVTPAVLGEELSALASTLCDEDSDCRIGPSVPPPPLRPQPALNLRLYSLHPASQPLDIFPVSEVCAWKRRLQDREN